MPAKFHIDLQKIMCVYRKPEIADQMWKDTLYLCMQNIKIVQQLCFWIVQQ